MNKYTILIDLDGVLNTYTGGYDENYIPPMKNGADEFLKKITEKNIDLKLFTTRKSELAEKWLKENNIRQYFSDVTNQKVPAILIIDNRCITFNGNYENILKQIENFKPWYKNY